MQRLKALALQLIQLAQRHPGLLALFGFISGMASFLLIERSEAIAQFIALTMLISWFWLVLEQTLHKGVLSRFGLDLPPALMRFATQMVHQESFFFVLPFFFAATHWGTGQVWATALLACCALISLIDPLYYGQLATRRALFVAFHALALFASLLVCLPIILHLTTGQSYFLALTLALLLSLPGLGALLPTGTQWRRPALVFLLALLATGAWHLRPHVAPVPMRLSDVAVTQEVDRSARRPGSPITEIDAQRLHQQGLYAWTAIRVPRGLRETVYHVWIQDNTVIDRIPLEVRGGREDGYRAWSFKQHFPARSEGNWQVRATTAAGRTIGLTRFRVIAAPPEDEKSPPSPSTANPIVERPLIIERPLNADGTEPSTREIEETLNPSEAVRRE